MKVHSTEKAFSCPECGTGFRHKNSLVRHSSSFHLEKLHLPFCCCCITAVAILKTLISLKGGNTRSLDPKNARCAVDSLWLQVV